MAWEVLTPHRSELADTMIKSAVESSASAAAAAPNIAAKNSI